MAVEELAIQEWESDEDPTPEEAELDALEAQQTEEDNEAPALPEAKPKAEAEEEAEEDEAEEEDENPAEEGELHDIMIDGEPAQVSTQEALNGYIREKTFHQRMNQVDQAKQTVMQHAQQVRAERTEYARRLQEAEALINTLMPQQAPDWDALYAQNPQQARQIQTQYEELQRTRAQVAQQQAEQQQAAMAQQAHMEQAFARTEFPKFAATTGWRTEADMQDGIEAMRQTAANVGFTEQEIGAIYDSRELAILHKAALYDKLMARRPANSKGGTRGAGQVAQQARKTGAAPRKAAPKDLTAAKQRHARIGTVDSAAAAFKRILESS